MTVIPTSLPAELRAVGRIHHVAVIVRDIEASLEVYRDLLGLELEAVMPIESDRVIIAFLGVGESKIELVQPTDETTGVARFLAAKGEGFHHLCLEVPDLAAMLTDLAAVASSSSTRLPGAVQRARWPSSTPAPAAV